MSSGRRPYVCVCIYIIKIYAYPRAGPFDCARGGVVYGGRTASLLCGGGSRGTKWDWATDDAGEREVAVPRKGESGDS